MEDFRTAENSLKFYWKGKSTEIDYPSSLVGTKTPSIFIWSKMEHLYSILNIGEKNPQEKIVVSGTNEYTAFEFMKIISDLRMWTFEKSLL